MKIIKATSEHLLDCMEALKYSKVGETYYQPDEKLKTALQEGIGKEEVYIAVDVSNNCLGYIWIALRGAFYGFPYCRSLAVKKEQRGKGVGTALLEYYEQVGFEYSNRLFMLVSDYNPDAKKLYERFGFQQVGLIPDLFKKGASEYILVKFRPEDDII